MVLFKAECYGGFGHFKILDHLDQPQLSIWVSLVIRPMRSPRHIGSVVNRCCRVSLALDWLWDAGSSYHPQRWENLNAQENIESLGKDNTTGIVTQVVLDTALLRETTNGLRIKTYQVNN
jgi:hypothetical protein